MEFMSLGLGLAATRSELRVLDLDLSENFGVPSRAACKEI